LELKVFAPKLISVYLQFGSANSSRSLVTAAAALPFARLIAPPILGIWADKSSSIAIPITASLIIFCVANVLHSLLHLLGSSSIENYILIVKLLLGAASANAAVCQSYIAKSTKPLDRINAFSIAALMQAFGFIAGGGLFEFGALRINMHSLVGWINLALGTFNIILLLKCDFKVQQIPVNSKLLTSNDSNTKNAACGLILIHFFIALSFQALPLLAVQLPMDQFTFTRSEATKWNSGIMIAGLLIYCFILRLLPRICRKLKEADVLLVGGLMLLTLGKFINIPFRKDSALPAYYLSIDDDHTMPGCPVATQPWCETSPKLGMPEYVVGYFLTVVG